VHDAVVAVLRAGVPQHKAWREYERRLRHEIARRSRYASLTSMVVRMPVLAPYARLFSPLLDAVSA
jgi:uncharacterized protein (DUF2336 family)